MNILHYTYMCTQYNKKPAISDRFLKFSVKSIRIQTHQIKCCFRKIIHDKLIVNED